MRKVEFIASREQTERGEQLPDGRIINIYRSDGTIHRYDLAFDLETGDLYPAGEHPDGTVTLNELYEKGMLKAVHCYDECTYNTNKYIGEIKTDDKFIKRVQAFFKEHGYNVTKKAIRHNIDAWELDYKSGYRDEANGYHLFTPCFHNPLSFTLTTLHPLCQWQGTYRV